MILTLKKSKLKHLWNSYWFSPIYSFDLGAIRLIIVLGIVINLILGNYFNRILTVSHFPDYVYTPFLHILNFFSFPLGLIYRPPFLLLALIWILSIITGITSLMGLKTNLSLVLFAVGNVILRTYGYSFGRPAHPDSVTMVALIILVVSPAGYTLSIDDLRRRINLNLKRQKFTAFDILNEQSRLVKWPILLIQWIVAISYFDAFLSKIHQGPTFISFDWVNGYTLQNYLSGASNSGWINLGYWLAHNNTLASLASWIAILFEGTFFLVLIFPKLIWLYIPIGLAFHLGIFFSMTISFFILFVAYSAFISWRSTLKILSKHLPIFSSPKKLEIFYDGRSPKCIRLMTILCYFDWFNNLSFSDSEKYWHTLAQSHPETSAIDYRQEIYVLLPNESIKQGFASLETILKYLPPLWPMRVLFYLPQGMIKPAKQLIGFN